MKKGQKNHLSMNDIGLTCYMKEILASCCVWHAVSCFKEKNLYEAVCYTCHKKKFSHWIRKRNYRSFSDTEIST